VNVLFTDLQNFTSALQKLLVGGAEFAESGSVGNAEFAESGSVGNAELAKSGSVSGAAPEQGQRCHNTRKYGFYKVAICTMSYAGDA
jgi:hypothetical protein